MCLRTVVIPAPLGTSFLGHPSGRAARSYRAWPCTTTLSSILLKAPPQQNKPTALFPRECPTVGAQRGWLAAKERSTHLSRRGSHHPASSASLQLCSKGPQPPFAS